MFNRKNGFIRSLERYFWPTSFSIEQGRSFVFALQ